LKEIVDKVLAAVGPFIEECIRKELQVQKDNYSRKQNESLAG
jgi:hypothetical protein